MCSRREYTQGIQCIKYTLLESLIDYQNNLTRIAVKIQRKKRFLANCFGYWQWATGKQNPLDCRSLLLEGESEELMLVVILEIAFDLVTSSACGQETLKFIPMLGQIWQQKFCYRTHSQ